MRRSFASLLLLACLVSSTAQAQLPALRDRPLSAAERDRVTQLEGELQRISRERNTSVAAVRSIARALGQRLTTENSQQLLREISERATELAAAKARIDILERDLEAIDSVRLAAAVRPLLTAATTAIENGDLVEAEGRLGEAAARFTTARTALGGRMAALSAREAELISQRASVRSSLADWDGAAELYAEAAALSEGVVRARYLVEQAQALNTSALLTGLGMGRWAEPQRLQRSLIVVEQALPFISESTEPVLWRDAQAALGRTALLFWRISNQPAALARAVEAYRASLATDGVVIPEDDVRERRSALAEVLTDLGRMTFDLALLREGQAEYQTLVASYPDDPYYVMVQGDNLQEIAAITGEVDQLSATLAVYQVALERAGGVLQNEAGRLLTASLQSRLGNTSHDIAEMSDNPLYAEQAIVSHRAAALVFGDRVNMNIANSTVTYVRLRPQEAARLAEAEGLLQQLISESSRERDALHWATLQDSLAGLLLVRARISRSIADLRRAREIAEAVKIERVRAGAQMGSASTLRLIGEIEAEIASLSPAGDQARHVALARDAYTAAASTYQRINAPAWVLRRSGEDITRLDADFPAARITGQPQRSGQVAAHQ